MTNKISYLNATMLCFWSGFASSSAFQVPSLSDGNLALSGAGSGAAADTATTAYTNPAGMPLLGKDSMTGVVGVMVYDNDYTSNAGAAKSAPNSGSTMPYASYYLVKQIDERMATGLAIASPGGASLNYGENWEGEEQINDVTLITLQINPSVGYKLNDSFSLGFGVVIEYITVDENLNIGQTNLKANSLDLGFNIGTIYELNNGNRFGLTYRSAIHHSLNGDISGNINGNVDLNIPNAAQIDFSGFHSLNDSFDFLWNIGTELWSQYDATYLSYDGRNPITAYKRNFNDTYSFSLGLRYKINEDYRLDMGTSYSSNPQKDDKEIYPDLPVNDIFNFGLGINYKISKAMDVNFAYQYNDYGERGIEQNFGNNGALGVQGSYKQKNQFFSAQLNYDY